MMSMRGFDRAVKTVIQAVYLSMKEDMAVEVGLKRMSIVSLLNASPDSDSSLIDKVGPLKVPRKLSQYLKNLSLK